MPKQLSIEIDDAVADLLDMAVHEINETMQESWTLESLAASFLTHVLVEDAIAERATVH